MLLNLVTNMYYVGQAINLNRRWINHIDELKSNRHGNKYLQAAWNKYGIEAFKFYVLEYVSDKSILIEREQYWLDKTKCYDRNVGYNLCSNASSCLGFKHSEETKLKMGKAKRGFIHTYKSRAKMSAHQLGKRLSEETKRKISLAKTGQKRPDLIERNKIIKPHKGHKHSEEAKAKMSKSKVGKRKLAYVESSPIQEVIVN